MTDSTAATTATADTGKIRVGAGYKLLPRILAPVKDAGRVKIGAGYKLLSGG